MMEAICDLLDARIRPSLQADGGDLHVVGLAGNFLSIHYQGACGSCPSSISGTLAAIERDPLLVVDVWVDGKLVEMPAGALGPAPVAVK